MDLAREKKLHLLILGSILLLAWIIRIYAAYDYWAWLDNYIPDIWQERTESLSQDASTYAQQAKRAIEKGYPAWGREAFYRPPLASFYFQYLFGITNFDRFEVSLVQASLAVFAYLLLFLSIKNFFSNKIAYLSILIISIHPVLIFYDVALEDSVPALLLLSLGIWLLSIDKILYRNHLLFGAAIVFSLACLARPNIALMLPAFGVWIWFRQKQANATAYETPPISELGSAYRFFAPILAFLVLNLIYSSATKQGLNMSMATFGAGWSFGYIEYFTLGFLLFIASYYTLNTKPYEKDNFIISGVLIGLAGFFYSAFFILALPLFFIALLKLRKIAYYNLKVTQRTSFFTTFTIFLIPTIAVIIITSIHNLVETGSASIIVPTSGENLYWGNSNNPDYLFSLQGNEPAPWLRESAPYRLYNVIIWEDFPNRYRSMFDAKREAALHYIQSNPIAFIQGLIFKAGKSLSNYEVPRNRNFSFIKQYIPAFNLWYVPFSIIFFLAIVSLIKFKKKNEITGILLFLIPPLAVLLTETIFFNGSRYRSLTLPFLIPVAILGFFQIRHFFNTNRTYFILALLGGLAFWQIGEHSVSEIEKNKYLSASLYKHARSLIISDGKDKTPGLKIRDNEKFITDIDKSLELFPGNISAFSLKQMYEIYVLNSPETALKQIAEYSTTCKSNDFVCSRTMTVLSRIASDPEAHIKSPVSTAQ